jgi:hypothetical protein
MASLRLPTILIVLERDPFVRLTPKYVMAAYSPIGQRICPQPQPQLTTPSIVSIPVRAECPEEKADRLRQWCIANCQRRWKPLERWTRSAVRFEFESLTDALLFRLSH